MNLTCDVIRDLLPLYHDGVCSDGSKSLVEEHLKGCEACRKELDMLNAELAMPHVRPEKEKSFKAVSFAWKKGKKKSFIKGILLTVLICAVLFGGYIGLAAWKCIPVSADVLEISQLSQLPDEGIAFRLSTNDNKAVRYIRYNKTDDGSFYLTPMRSVMEAIGLSAAGPESTFFNFYPPGYKTSEPDHPGIFLPENTTKIYVGPVGEGTLVWEKGMELPDAGEALRQRYGME